jgi:hypothetical protein
MLDMVHWIAFRLLRANRGWRLVTLRAGSRASVVVGHGAFA